MFQRARQRWALKAMENELKASEPRLTAMFAIFERLAHDEQPGGVECLPG